MGNYDYYWKRRKQKDAYKRLDWDKVVFYTIITPTYIVFGFLFVAAYAINNHWSKF